MTNKVIILAGQSNAVGSNAIPNPPPVYVNDSRIWVKRQPWHSVSGLPIDPMNPGSGAWVQIPDPISGYPGGGVNPGKAMADKYITLKADPALNIGIVPCGVGATPIDYSPSLVASWDRTMFWNQPFPHLVCRTLEAMNWGEVIGMLWMQGESDTGSFPHPQFMRSTMDLFYKFRQRIDIRDLPIVYTQLGPNPNSTNYPHWSNVQNFQLYASTCDPKIKMITTSDLSIYSSAIDTLGVHFDAAAALTIGHRAATALATMT